MKGAISALRAACCVISSDRDEIERGGDAPKEEWDVDSVGDEKVVGSKGRGEDLHDAIGVGDDADKGPDQDEQGVVTLVHGGEGNGMGGEDVCDGAWGGGIEGFD